MGTGGREEAFETAFQFNPLPLTITRVSDGLIFDANPAWLARLGFTRDEVVGRRMSDIGFSAYPTLEPELVETPSMSTRDRIVSARAKSGEIVEVIFSAARHEFRGEWALVTATLDVTQWASAERALRASEQRFRTIAENTSDIIWTLDPETERFTYVSPAVTKVLGMTPEEVMARAARDILAPDSYAQMVSRLRPALEALLSGTHRLSPQTLEVELRRADGSLVHVEATAALARDERGQIKLLGVARDVTDRLRAESALRESEEKYRALVRSSSDPIFRYDREERYSFGNEAFARRFGRTPEEIVGMSARDLFPPDQAERRLATVRKVFATGVGTEYEGPVLGADGETRIFLTILDPVRDDAGNVTAVACIAKDITDRKRQEQALRESEERYRSLTEAAFDGVVVARHGIVVDASRRMADMFGYDLSELLGVPVAQLLAPQAHDLRGQRLEIRPEHDDDIVEPYETTGLRRGGTRFRVEVRPKYTSYDGQPARMAAVRDITERLQAEEALHNSAAVNQAVLDSLGANIAVLDDTGAIAATNAAWRQFALENGAADPTTAYLGYNYLDVCRQAAASGDATAGEVLAGLEGVLAGASNGFGLEYSCDSPIEHRWFSLSAKPLAGRSGWVVVSHLDITALRQAEVSLRQERDLLTTLVDAIPESVYIKDVSGRFTKVNRQLAASVGLSPEALVGKTDFDLGYLGQAQASASFADEQQIISTGQPLLDKLEVFRRSDGSERFVRTTKVPIWDSDGTVRGIAGISRDITERHLASERVLESEESYRILFESSADSLFLVDRASGGILEANESACRTYGYSRDELRRMKYVDISTDPVGTAAAISAATDTMFVPLRLHRKRDGSVFPVEIRASAVPYHGKPVLIASVRDITDRGRAEAIFEANRARLEFIGALRQRTNPTYEQICDYALEQSLRLTASDIGYLYFYDEDARVFTPYSWSNKVVALCKIQEKRTTFALDDTGLWGEAIRQRKPIITNDYSTPNPLVKGYPEGHIAVRRHLNIPVFADNRIVAVLGVGNKAQPYTDEDVLKLTTLSDGFWRVIERVQAEQALAASESKYRQLVDLAQEGIWATDASGITTFANRRMEEILGYSPDEMVGKHGSAFRVPSDVPNLLASVEDMRRGVARRFEHEIVRKDGTLVAVRVVETPIFDETGVYAGALALVDDITEERKAAQARKELEQELVQAQKMEAIGALAGGIAHDFNNVLGIIMGHASLLDLQLEPDSPLHDAVRTIDQACARGASLTQQLLGFARRGRLGEKPLSPASLIDEVAQLIRRTFDRSIEITTSTDGSTLFVVGDANHLHQVLMNLAINARDSMPRGGQLTLAVTEATLDADFVRTRPTLTPGRYVVITLTDTGTGMPPEVRARIFEPFFTTKEVGKGTGLGLASAYGIVQRHRGHLEVESEVGRGTTMRIYLPAVPGHTSDGRASREGEMEHGTATVLLVDDEPAIRQFGKAVLTRLGYTVLLASDGAEAVDLYRSRPGEIGLVVLDLNMPVLSGAGSAQELLRLDPGCRILIATGYAVEEQADDLILLGAVGIVQKPFRARVLADAVRNALARRS